jgi:hypothetical protein
MICARVRGGAAAGSTVSCMAERLAFRLIYDYTLGFALSDRTSPSEQRLQDAATRHQLHAFLQSLPTDRFPVLAAIGEHVWLDDRDQRFTASIHTLISGLQAAQPAPATPSTDHYPGRETAPPTPPGIHANAQPDSPAFRPTHTTRPERNRARHPRRPTPACGASLPM